MTSPTVHISSKLTWDPKIKKTLQHMLVLNKHSHADFQHMVMQFHTTSLFSVVDPTAFAMYAFTGQGADATFSLCTGLGFVQKEVAASALVGQLPVTTVGEFIARVFITADPIPECCNYSLGIARMVELPCYNRGVFSNYMPQGVPPFVEVEITFVLQWTFGDQHKMFEKTLLFHKMGIFVAEPKQSRPVVTMSSVVFARIKMLLQTQKKGSLMDLISMQRPVKATDLFANKEAVQALLLLHDKAENEMLVKALAKEACPKMMADQALLRALDVDDNVRIKRMRLP